MKRFKLKSLNELPDYEELLKKIAEINSLESLKPESDYLYEKDVYDPETDAEAVESKEIAATETTEDAEIVDEIVEETVSVEVPDEE